MTQWISIRGAQEHNLKSIDIDIPKNKLVTFTGVSGSGKSSLVFDTIYAEAFRRFSDASHVPVYLIGKSQWSKIKRPVFHLIKGLPPAIGLSQKQGVSGPLSTVGTISGISDLLRVYFAAFGKVYCKNCNIPLIKSTFNDILEEIKSKFDGKKIIFIAPIAEKRKGGFASEIDKFRKLGFSKININGALYDLQDETPGWKIDAKKLNTIEVYIDTFIISSSKTERIQRAVKQGVDFGKGLLKIYSEEINEFLSYNTLSGCPQCGESAPRLDPRYFSHSSIGQCGECHGSGSEKENLPKDIYPCRVCHGTRLNPNRTQVKYYHHTYEELHEMNIEKLVFAIDNLFENSKNDLAKIKVIGEAKRLVDCMVQLNLKHLSLGRAGRSLSPGDLQRIRLASIVANQLRGAIYVLDEPCQGLTAKEVLSLVDFLKKLVANGSSILCVEHHPTFLEQSDVTYIMGPGAGRMGGEIIESYEGKKTHKEKVIEGKIKTDVVSKTLPQIIFSSITARNFPLQQLTLPLQAVTIIRGRAGVGKKSFVELCLLPALHECLLEEEKQKNARKGKVAKKDKTLSEEQDEDYIYIPSENSCRWYLHKADTSPVTSLSYITPGTMSRSSRRSVASTLEVLPFIRELFASLSQSQLMGLTESHFSWHSKLGSCENCKGRGYVELVQKYSPPIQVTCEVCLGAKLNSRSLMPRFKGYHMAEIMNLSLDETNQLFQNQPAISHRLQSAINFGLGYVQLGQSLSTLSGGELQRLLLTVELKRANLSGAWFVLMHPGTGLHEPDIKILGNLICSMKEKGATFVLVENREEFLPFGDHKMEV